MVKIVSHPIGDERFREERHRKESEKKADVMDNVVEKEEREREKGCKRSYKKKESEKIRIVEDVILFIKYTAIFYNF